MRVLLAVDGTDNSYKNVAFLARLLSADDEVIVYCNSKATDELREKGLTPGSLASSVATQLQPKLDTKVRTRIENHAVELDGITAVADTFDAEIISMPHAHVHWWHRVIGVGLTESVIARFTRSVLIGHVGIPDGMPLRYLVCVDETGSRDAIEAVSNFIRPWDQVTVYHAVSMPSVVDALYQDDATWQAERRFDKRRSSAIVESARKEILLQTRGVLEDSHVDVRVDDFVLSVGGAIHDRDKQDKYHCIVLGAHIGETFMDKFFSTKSQYILSHSETALLIARPHTQIQSPKDVQGWREMDVVQGS